MGKKARPHSSWGDLDEIGEIAPDKEKPARLASHRSGFMSKKNKEIIT